MLRANCPPMRTQPTWPPELEELVATALLSGEAGLEIHEVKRIVLALVAIHTDRIATVLSKRTLPQHALAKTLGLEQLRITPHGQYCPS